MLGKGLEVPVQLALPGMEKESGICVGICNSMAHVNTTGDDDLMISRAGPRLKVIL